VLSPKLWKKFLAQFRFFVFEKNSLHVLFIVYYLNNELSTNERRNNFTLLNIRNKKLHIFAVLYFNSPSLLQSWESEAGGRGGRGPFNVYSVRAGGRAPLDFHTWFWQSRERLNGVIFRFCFSVAPLDIFLPTPLFTIHSLFIYLFLL